MLLDLILHVLLVHAGVGKSVLKTVCEEGHDIPSLPLTLA